MHTLYLDNPNYLENQWAEDTLYPSSAKGSNCVGNYTRMRARTDDFIKISLGCCSYFLCCFEHAIYW